MVVTKGSFIYPELKKAKICIHFPRECQLYISLFFRLSENSRLLQKCYAGLTESKAVPSNSEEILLRLYLRITIINSELNFCFLCAKFLLHFQNINLRECNGQFSLWDVPAGNHGSCIHHIQVNIWKFIYLNCGEWYEDMIDHRSYTHNLRSCEIKAWKKIQACTGFAPMTSAIPVRWSIMSPYHSPQFRYMKVHIFTWIPHKWPAPSWFDGSVGRALHRHRRSHGFESRSVLNFFPGFNFTTA